MANLLPAWPSPGPRDDRSTPTSANTSLGSQQAPRSRSTQKSLRMLTICSPCPKRNDKASNRSRRLLRPGEWSQNNFRERLANDARDAVAVSIQVAHVIEPARRHRGLELGHPRGHDADAALDRVALRAAESARDPDDRIGVGHQVPLGLDCRFGQHRMEIPTEFTRRGRTFHDADESIEVDVLLLHEQGGFVLDRVSYSTQQVGVADNVAQRLWQLRNGERESP